MDDSGFHLKDDDSKLQFLNQLAGAYTGADNQGVVNIPQEIAEITQTSQPAIAESAPVRSAGYNAAMNGDGLETYYQNINNYLAQPRTQEEIQDAMQFYSVSQDDIDAARGSLDTGVMDVPASAEPSPYADGGGAFKKLQWQEPQHFDGGGMAVDLSEGEPLFTKKELETIKRNAPAVYDWAKQNVKDEASQLKTAGGMKDFALRVGAQYAGGIPDLINAGLMIPDALAGTKLASEKPWFGSEQMIDAMHKVGMLGENEFPISETLAGILAPAGLIKKGVKKGYQAYKGMKPDAPKKQRGGLAAMSR